MMPDARTTIIVVSDLHLGAGHTSDEQREEFPEPFVHDFAFSRWLHVMREEALAYGGENRLLLLGDLFDFPRVRRVTKVSASPESIDRATITRLDRIAAGHPAVFTALRHWLAAGLPIDIVPGNHDFELMRPAVYEHLKHLLAPPESLEEGSGDIRIFPWIYYIPGLLYAEHGQQYHDLNSFPALVDMETAIPGRRFLPPGAALDTFALRAIGKLGPEVDSPNSVTQLLRNILRTGPRGMAGVIPDIAQLIAALGADLVARRLPPHRLHRERYRSGRLPAQARATGIPVGVLSQIDFLAETTANGLPGRVVRAGLRKRNLPGERPTADYMVRAASRIRSILDRAQMGTAFYIFGHSHRPMQVALDGGRSQAFYLNSGAWAWQGARKGPCLTFLRLTWDPALGEATASLEKWNDQLGKSDAIETLARVSPQAAGPGTD